MKKYIIAAPMPDQTAETVIQTFIDSIVVENGVPERVMTDQGSNFLSRTIDDLYRQFGIERLRTTTYSPCCDLKI
jgi:FMN-dependent NADH-azoreductase